MICFLKSLIVPHTHSCTHSRTHTRAHTVHWVPFKDKDSWVRPWGRTAAVWTYCSLEIEPASIRGVEMVIKPLLKPDVIKNPRGCKNHKGCCRLQGLIVIIWTVNPEPWDDQHWVICLWPSFHPLNVWASLHVQNVRGVKHRPAFLCRRIKWQNETKSTKIDETKMRTYSEVWLWCETQTQNTFENVLVCL